MVAAMPLLDPRARVEKSVRRDDDKSSTTDAEPTANGVASAPMGELHNDDTATAIGETDSDETAETTSLLPAEKPGTKAPVAYSESDTDLGDVIFGDGTTLRERAAAALSRALPFVAVALAAAAVAVVVVVGFVMRPGARPAPASTSTPAADKSPATVAPASPLPTAPPVAAAPAPPSIATSPSTAEAASTEPHLLPDSAAPGTLSGGLPNDIYDEFGVCNYLTTHTEQASGGIESLALLGEQQGMGPSKSQGIIQQAVTNVCPWNQSTFAKHVMTDTSNF